MSNNIDKALDTQLDEILTELADEHFYEGAEIGNDDYATDGYEAHTSVAKAKLKILLNEVRIDELEDIRIRSKGTTFIWIDDRINELREGRE